MQIYGEEIIGDKVLIKIMNLFISFHNNYKYYYLFTYNSECCVMATLRSVLSISLFFAVNLASYRTRKA